MRRLTEEEASAAFDALMGAQGGALREAMFALSLGRSAEEAGLSTARALGWVDHGLTALGQLIADPLREFGFWLARERQLPSESLVPDLQRQRYAGKRVVEVGSGGGCNLLSLSGLPASLVGVEPMPVYLQMMPVLAKIAGLPCPEAVEASARAMPLPDRSADLVLCYSSHQYMDVRAALREMHRVLAPGGELVIVGNSLVPFGSETVTRFARGRSLGTLKYDLTAIANTMSYQFAGRRLFQGRGGTSTAVPIYPTRAFMRDALDDTGFTLAAHRVRALPSGETALFAIKR
ncbi:MAG: methyltransferase domain-containing protein [Myxococcota bacterium]